jgi:hypothetical protein
LQAAEIGGVAGALISVRVAAALRIFWRRMSTNDTADASEAAT